jgi:hypothetical protein
VTPFVVLAWLAAAIGTALIGWVFARRRYLFVKPSVLLLAASNVLFQWPMAIWSGWIESYLPDPVAPLIFVSAFVLLGVPLVSVTWRYAAWQSWQRITTRSAGTESRALPIFLLVAISGIIASWYFSANPLTSTGLFLTLAAPELAATAREASLKELASLPLRYGFTMFLASFGPLLGALVALEARAQMQRRAWSLVVVMVILLLLTAAMMSITGARSYAATLLLAVALAFYMRAGMPFRPVLTAMLLIILIVPAAAITILREGHSITPALLVQYTTLVLFDRVLVGPAEVGLWYVHFAQTQQLFGIAAVAKLAALFGVAGVNPPNLIGLTYSPFGFDYVNANASFVFTYYSYFGAFALVLVLASLVILDALVLLYRWIAPAMLLPAVAVTSVSGLALLSADFHSALISNGLITTPLLAALLRPVKASGAGARAGATVTG